MPHILSRWEHLAELEDVYREHFCLAIQWNGATQEQIIADFARWVSQEAKRHPEMKPRGKAGQVPIEPLKWLAAYRLAAAGFTCDAAQEFLDNYADKNPVTEGKRTRLPQFEDGGDWRRAIKKACQRVKEFGG